MSLAPPITCSGCDHAWSGTGAAHCASCHHTFATAGLFDLHRSQYGERGACLEPEQVLKSGVRALFLRDGMWRGPELTDEQRVRFGRQ